MHPFILDRKTARLILLQRIELSDPYLKRLRKLFGRYIFTNLITKFLISPNLIAKNYKLKMFNEFNNIKSHFNFNNKNILSIGAGICGLEMIIYSQSKNSKFTIIERNYVSKKVRYGWDNNNFEAYNDLSLTKNFLLKNGMKKEDFIIYNFDKNDLPVKKFDLIISLYSLDYHYDFDIYKPYLSKILNQNTYLILDTIRPEYFERYFNEIKIIKKETNTVHKSSRIICSGYKIND